MKSRFYRIIGVLVAAFFAVIILVATCDAAVTKEPVSLASSSVHLLGTTTTGAWSPSSIAWKTKPAKAVRLAYITRGYGSYYRTRRYRPYYRYRTRRYRPYYRTRRYRSYGYSGLPYCTGCYGGLNVYRPRVYYPKVYRPSIYYPRVYVPRVYVPKVYSPKVYRRVP